jgi:hypothetical protein
MQSTTDRADRHLQNLRHGFVLLIFKILEDQDRAMLRRQSIQGRLDSPFFIGPFERLIGLTELGQIMRLGHTPLPSAAGAQANGSPLFALQADGRVDRDPVKPGEKLRISFEAVQRLIRVKKRFLNNILSVFRAIDQSIYRVEEPILVTADQLTEGRGLAFPALLDESMLVVAHGDLWVGRWKRLDSSRKRLH